MALFYFIIHLSALGLKTGDIDSTPGGKYINIPVAAFCSYLGSCALHDPSLRPFQQTKTLILDLFPVPLQNVSVSF